MNNFTLAFADTQAVSLRDALQKQYIGGVLPTNITITINAQPHAAIDIIDDLLLDAAINPLVKHSITINAQENSKVTYKLRLVEDNAHPALEKLLTVNLNGQHAHVDAQIACFNKGAQILKINTVQNHIVGDSFSNIMIKTIGDDASQFTCNSMIRIVVGAQRSTAEQGNRNILLSKKARATSIPQLEVEANDVRCKHGAAVSTLNNDHLFYLASRGISADAARSMLLAGFLS